jgi:hypothetical protein
MLRELTGEIAAGKDLSRPAIHSSTYIKIKRKRKNEPDVPYLTVPGVFGAAAGAVAAGPPLLEVLS